MGKKKNKGKIDFEMARPFKMTRKGTRPNSSAKPKVPGSGRNRPAKGYNQELKIWEN